MSNVLLIALFKDMVPPKDPYIKVRIVDDIDEGIVMSDKTTNFARHSMHFLKRTDAEPYIARVSLFIIPCLKLSHTFLQFLEELKERNYKM